MFKNLPLTIAILMLLSFPSVTRSSTTDGFDKEFWVRRYLSVSYPLSNLVITSPYGKRRDPISGEMSLHTGVDLRARNEAVFSMFDGMVVETGENERAGKYMRITHDNIIITYCHLSKVLISKGDLVLAGDKVAISGNTGRTTGPHLHISAKIADKPINPSLLFAYVKAVQDEAMEKLSSTVSTEGFIARHKDLALIHEERYGIPASVTMSQMIVESNWGRSRLALESNNYFGIKCSQEWLSQKKPYVLHDDDQKGEKFCVFDSVEECMNYHSKLLLSDRYKRCYNYPPSDYHNWLKEIKSAGYATDERYVQSCEDVIRQYKLYRLKLD